MLAEGKRTTIVKGRKDEREKEGLKRRWEGCVKEI